jgi:hypothetical protein
MFNPLANISDLSDLEIENKISELGRKYFQTQNPQLQSQISVLLEMYKEEFSTRKVIAAQREKENNNNDDNSLDNLIKVS